MCTEPDSETMEHARLLNSEIKLSFECLDRSEEKQCNNICFLLNNVFILFYFI